MGLASIAHTLVSVTTTRVYGKGEVALKCYIDLLICVCFLAGDGATLHHQETWQHIWAQALHDNALPDGSWRRAVLSQCLSPSLPNGVIRYFEALAHLTLSNTHLFVTVPAYLYHTFVLKPTPHMRAALWIALCRILLSLSLMQIIHSKSQQSRGCCFHISTIFAP